MHIEFKYSKSIQIKNTLDHNKLFSENVKIIYNLLIFRSR